MSDNTQSDVVVDSSPQVEVVEPIEAEKVETEGESESAKKLKPKKPKKNTTKAAYPKALRSALIR